MDQEAVVSSAQRIRAGLTRATPSSSIVNPFVSASSGRMSLYERVKVAVGAVLLLPIRVLALLTASVVAFGCARLSLVGIDRKDLDKPITGWRRAVLTPIAYVPTTSIDADTCWVATCTDDTRWSRWLMRGVLFVCGFYYIRVKGRCAPPQDAPIVVSNHCTFWDAVFHFYYLNGPVGVAKGTCCTPCGV
jgi:hypothetical protein